MPLKASEKKFAGEPALRYDSCVTQSTWWDLAFSLVRKSYHPRQPKYLDDFMRPKWRGGIGVTMTFFTNNRIRGRRAVSSAIHESKTHWGLPSFAGWPSCLRSPLSLRLDTLKGGHRT